ncbi:MAG: FAD-dependent oxidoreductase, partial [Pseudomonadota bacterium]
LIKGLSLHGVDLINNPQAVRQMPISDEARQRLERFVTLDTHVWPGVAWEKVEARLRSMSYFDFLREHGGLDDECLAVFNNFTHEIAGQSLVNYSAREALWIGLPGWNLLGEGLENTFDWDYRFAMFPDGNASIARLMVQQLIPSVSPGANFENISLADFDYAQLDRPEHSVRLRLNATAVRVRNRADGVVVNTVVGGQLRSVKARHAVLACYHAIIPHLCPDMPEAQREAQKYQVKCPMLITNVLLRDSKAWNASGVSSAWCPGRMHTMIVRLQGNTAGGYTQGSWDNREGPMTLAFFGSIEEPPGALDLKARLRAARSKMLTLTLEDYEREVRTVLDGLLGPYGFDVKRDVLAITVNRWPHGYSYFYRDLWDPDFEDGQYPHQLASKPFGNITIANADRVADAYTHTAIDVARDAVAELPA